MTQYSVDTEYIWKKCVPNFAKIQKSEYYAFCRALEYCILLKFSIKLVLKKPTIKLLTWLLKFVIKRLNFPIAMACV